MFTLNNNDMETQTLKFENIYNENHAKVLNLINYKLGAKNKETAEEIANDVFIRVHKHLNNYKPEESSLTTWIYNIANNLVIDHYRRKSLDTMHISAMVDSEGKETFEYTSPTLNPEETMVNYEQGQMVANAIEALPVGYRRLTEMFFMEQCSHKEIVQELELPLNTVKVQIMRAKKLLKDFLS